MEPVMIVAKRHLGKVMTTKGNKKAANGRVRWSAAGRTDEAKDE
jgi:hypothetical protein